MLPIETRQQMATAVSTANTEFERLKPIVEILTTELSNPVVKTDEDRIKVSDKINEAKKAVTEVKNARMEVTRHIDAYKKAWMNKQEEITRLLDGNIEMASEACNEFVKAEQEKVRKEQEEIQKKKELEIALNTYQAKLTSAIEKASQVLIEELQSIMTKSWLSITKENFAEKAAGLKAYRPVFKDIQLTEYLHKFNERNPAPETVKFDITALVKEHSHKIAEEYIKAATQLKQNLIDQLPAKQKEIEDADNAKKQLEEFEKAETLRKEEAIKAQAIADKEIEDKAKMDAEIQAQVASQSIEQMKNVKTKKVCTANPNCWPAWDDAIKFYKNNGGDMEKLNFILTFMSEKGCPVIGGFTYSEEVKNIAKRSKK